MQKWKKSCSLSQMSFRDHVDPKQTYLYQLSKKPCEFFLISFVDRMFSFRFFFDKRKVSNFFKIFYSSRRHKTVTFRFIRLESKFVKPH